MHLIPYLMLFLSILGMTQTNYAMESAAENLYLVVGNSRKEGDVNFWWKRIMGSETHFTHKATFAGKATSLDIEPCAIADVAHIQADAKTYNPGSQRIQAVFMELFPSINIKIFGSTEYIIDDAQAELIMLRLLPDVVSNLSRYMIPGATLEIEHIPHFTLTDPKFYAECSSYLKRKNPFHAFLSPLFNENLKARNYQGVERKVEYWQEVKDKKLSDGWAVGNVNAIIHEAVETHPWILQALCNVQRLLDLAEEPFNKKINAEIALFENNQQRFSATFHNSLSSVVAQEFCLLSQQDAIKGFLEKKGFENISIDHQNNPYNGRKNVWIIAAAKKKS